MKNGQKIIVAMSGGVDSSVAAALLKKQAYNIAGVFMRFWSEGKRENGCCSIEAESAARLVAEKLEIPFYVLDFQKEFKQKVVDHFLAEIASGRTPNPCVVCNPEIKFGLLMEKAVGLGFDLVATGHYARLRREFLISPPGFAWTKSGAGGQFPKKSQNARIKLYQAKDGDKDQSYFLYRLNQEQLGRIIFPIGNLNKKEVIALAGKFNLPYHRAESFDICFMADYEEFIANHLKLVPGKIIDQNGKDLGEHQGLALYTIGQRASIGGPGPFYVVGKDEKENILYASNQAKDLDKKEMLVNEISWTSGRAPKLPLKAKVKVRYRTPAAPCLIKFAPGKLRVVFKKPQRAITPGQSAVFYKGKEVLGGGFIQ